MIHLFDKTYLDVDQAIDLHTNRIVISKTQGHKMLELLDTLSAGELFAYGETEEQLFDLNEDFNSIEDVLKFCFNFNKTTGKKVVIYCDTEALCKVASVFYKTIFKEIDSVAAYKIVNYAFLRDELMGRRQSAGSLGGMSFLDNVKPTQEQFTEIFESAQVEEGDLFDLVKLKLSVEYYISSYLFDGSYKDETKSIVKLMITRNTQENLREVWRTVQLLILRKSVQEGLGSQTYTLDNLGEMLQDPALQVLKNVSGWNEDEYAFSESVDLSSLKNADVTKLKSQVNWVFKNIFEIADTAVHIDRMAMYIDISRKTSMSDADLTGLFDLERRTASDDRFWSLKDRNNINVYLLESFINSSNDQKQEVLAPYILK